MRDAQVATGAALICEETFLLHTIYYLIKIQLFCPALHPPKKLPFWASQHCYSILAKSHTSLRWGIFAHKDPLPAPM